MTRRYVLGTLSYILAFVLAFVSPATSLALIVVLALIFVLPEPEGSRNTRRRSVGGERQNLPPSRQVDAAKDDRGAGDLAQAEVLAEEDDARGYARQGD
jgi:hypothetical protein